MKKLLLLLVVGFFLFNSCEEIGPDIDFNPLIESADDTTYVVSAVPSPQDRVAMLEEFTGIKCVNCVAGHEKITELKDKFGDRLVAASIHATFFARPVPNKSVIDFRTTEADNIAVDLGVSGLPAGVVDRKIFPTETGFPVGVAKWESYINNQLNEVSKLNLDLAVKNYNESDSTYTVQATIVFMEDIPGSLNITLMVTENGIEEYQLGPQTSSNPTGELPNYIHNEVMRATITPSGGTLLSAPDFNRGRVIVKNFELKLRPNWDPDQLHVLGFVHFVGSEKTIIQADEITL